MRVVANGVVVVGDQGQSVVVVNRLLVVGRQPVVVAGRLRHIGGGLVGVDELSMAKEASVVDRRLTVVDAAGGNCRFELVFVLILLDLCIGT